MYSDYFRVFLVTLGNILSWAIIVRIILSWVKMSGKTINPSIERFVASVSDPVIRFFQILPHRIGMFDLSPLIALIAIDIFIVLVNQIL